VVRRKIKRRAVNVFKARDNAWAVLAVVVASATVLPAVGVVAPLRQGSLVAAAATGVGMMLGRMVLLFLRWETSERWCTFRNAPCEC
jgi:hypothetical protein